jgi:8-amino-7-oxononanoate synthase
MSSFEYLQDRLAEISRHDRRRRLVPHVTRGVWLSEPGQRELINFGSNDYLGLAAGRDLLPQTAGSGATSTGSGASALVCGWSTQHQALAEQIAELESTESAVVFPTGFAACSGTVATLAEAGDLILSDRLNHASLIDGCRLSRAARLVFPHRDCEAVQQILQRRRGEFARVWIVTDAVFSMDGHLAPLPQLCDLAEQYDATVVVDEAHGTGVFGGSGSGLCEELGVKDRVPIRIGTLSKAIGSQGGFVAAPRAVSDYLVNRCRSLIYSTALAPPAVAAAGDAIVKILGEPERRFHLHRLARRVREGLSIEVDPVEARGPIIPVPMGEDRAAVAASQRLAEAGFFVPAIRPPTVPEGGARLRISLSAAHEESMIDALVAAIHGIRPHE